MPTRINARLDDELASKVEAFRKKTGQTLTAVVEAALEAWVSRSEATDPLRAFEASGFVGVGKGPADLARNPKKYLKDSVRKKA